MLPFREIRALRVFTAAALCPLLLTLAPTASCQSPTPVAKVGGAIRIWGHGQRGKDYLLTLLQAWQSAFQQIQPGSQFVDELDGDASGLGGIYTNVADLALLDREASFTEADAYQQGTGYAPFRIPIARGSVNTPNHAPALKIFVNWRNPLRQLTLAQLDAVIDADHRSAKRSFKTWSDLGLTGEWATNPIHVYTYDIQSDEIQFFEHVALKGSQKFTCGVTRFPKDGGNADHQITAAVSRDRYGLAIMATRAPSLKPVPLAGNSALAVLPTPDTIGADTYPLARTIYAYANRKPSSPLTANVVAFLAFIVSPEGQAIAARIGGYLPLNPQQAAQARESLQ